MEIDKYIKQQQLITSAIWFIFCIVNLIFFCFIWFDIIQENPGVDSTWIFYSILALPAAAISLVTHHRAHSIKRINEQYQNIYPSLSMKQTWLPPAQFAQLSLSDQRKYILFYDLLKKKFIAWALVAFIHTNSIVALVLGMPVKYYYCFFAVVISLLLYMFPRKDRILSLN